MLGDLHLPGQPDRETRPELTAQRVDEELRGPVEPVVLTLRVDDEALRPVSDGRDRNGGLGERVLAVGERPAAHRDARGREPAQQRRGKLRVGRRSIPRLDEQRVQAERAGLRRERLRRALCRDAVDPKRCSRERAAGRHGPPGRRHPEHERQREHAQQHTDALSWV